VPQLGARITLALLELENIAHEYRRGGILGGSTANRVLHGISLELVAGATVALVGESGCGKTTLGKIVADLVRPSEGRVVFDGKAISDMSRSEYATFRRSVQFIHQEPYASLNPTSTVGRILEAPLKAHGITKNRREGHARVGELLETVGLSPVDDFRDKYPHQLSGGQRQRVSIARSITLDPRVIVADEAVSMVDVSLRIELLDLLLDLQRRLGIAYVFVSHDFGVVRYFARNHRTAVMYLGHIVELGDTDDIIQRPEHPYTRALLAAVPVPDPDAHDLARPLPLIDSEPPANSSAIPGCKFHPRCLYAVGACRESIPPLEDSGANPDHVTACFLAGTLQHAAAETTPEVRTVRR